MRTEVIVFTGLTGFVVGAKALSIILSGVKIKDKEEKESEDKEDFNLKGAIYKYLNSTSFKLMSLNFGGYFTSRILIENQLTKYKNNLSYDPIPNIKAIGRLYLITGLPYRIYSLFGNLSSLFGEKVLTDKDIEEHVDIDQAVNKRNVLNTMKVIHFSFFTGLNILSVYMSFRSCKKDFNYGVTCIKSPQSLLTN